MVVTLLPSVVSYTSNESSSMRSTFSMVSVVRPLQAGESAVAHSVMLERVRFVMVELWKQPPSVKATLSSVTLPASNI